jgi:hypothetical protein
MVTSPALEEASMLCGARGLWRMSPSVTLPALDDAFTR